jgi:hypothetical protein
MAILSKDLSSHVCEKALPGILTGLHQPNIADANHASISYHSLGELLSPYAQLDVPYGDLYA